MNLYSNNWLRFLMYFIDRNKAKLFIAPLLFFSISIFAQIDSKEVFISVEIDQDKIFVGEHVNLYLVIYTKVGIEETEILSDLEPMNKNSFYTSSYYSCNDTPVEKELDGEFYMRKVLSQFVLYPYMEGQFALSAAQVKIGRKIPNNSKLKYDTLELKEPYPITISALPEETRFAPKNGRAMSVLFNDSLSVKGIWIVDIEYYALSDPSFIQPADFSLGKKATVEVELLNHNHKILENTLYSTTTFRHIISFHEEGDYLLSTEWPTWNTKEEKWRTLWGETKEITIKKTIPRKPVGNNIIPTLSGSRASEDIVFLVDVSTSMLAQDFIPNRYEAVKTILKKMVVNKTADQQMSIVIFAGEGLILCPLTTDSAELSAAIDAILIDKLYDGTAIGEGMMYGLHELSKSNSSNKHLFILTDGINNAGMYSPKLASQVANELNIQVHSFGIGCQGEAICPIAKKRDGSFIFGKAEVQIDELILKNIGEQTGGNYTRITCNSDFTIVENLKELIKKSNPKVSTSIKIPSGFIEIIWRNIQYKNEQSKKKYYSNN